MLSWASQAHTSLEQEVSRSKQSSTVAHGLSTLYRAGRTAATHSCCDCCCASFVCGQGLLQALTGYFALQGMPSASSP